MYKCVYIYMYIYLKKKNGIVDKRQEQTIHMKGGEGKKKMNNIVMYQNPKDDK